MPPLPTQLQADLGLDATDFDTAATFKVPTSCSPTDTDPLEESGGGTNSDNCFTSASTDGLGTVCPTGTIGLVTSNSAVKVCALCPAGSFCDGSSSQACEGGTTTSGVGKDACGTDCPVGTYAPAGTYPCLPCPAGSYASAAKTAVCEEW